MTRSTWRGGGSGSSNNIVSVRSAIRSNSPLKSRHTTIYDMCVPRLTSGFLVSTFKEEPRRSRIRGGAAEGY